MHFHILALFFLSLFSLTHALPINRRGGSYSGDGTFYTVGLGSCGKTNSNSQMVAALSGALMGSSKKYCGQQITATHGGNSVTVTVVDTCPGCSKGSVDFSPAAFEKLASLDEGRISIDWSFS